MTTSPAPSSSAVRRARRIVVVVDDYERELIAAQAKRAGLSQSSWLRTLAHQAARSEGQV